MSFFTTDQFASIARRKAGPESFTNVLAKALSESSVGKSTTIFLSHSHQNRDQVAQAITFFKSIVSSIYIDWMDDSMPSKPNGTTASKLKIKIITNKRFILLATNEAVASKWCNWELGIGDAYKLHDDKLAILPLADNRGNWIGNEYLQIYPRIEQVENHDNIFRLYYPNGSSKWLDDWLKS